MAFSRASGLEQLLQRPEYESRWQRFLRSPVRYLANLLCQLCQPTRDATATMSTPTADSRQITVVCTSDTHNAQPRLPDGDILLHAGDLTQSGTVDELNEQIKWLDTQPHRYKVVIAGNHELCLDQNKSIASASAQIHWRSLTYLQHSSTTLHFESHALRIFGSPYTPQHGNWAFQYPRTGPGPWESNIPGDTDILLTHGPPKSHLDLGHMGCAHLLRALWCMPRKPGLHVFGHIHGGYGEEVLCWDEFQAVYERVMAVDCGWVSLVKLAWYALRRGRVWFFGGSEDREYTRLVNAAAVGGVRDKMRRDPIVVAIRRD
ncbi:Calcineurin-like phosphoesterase [Aspergillus sp. HF37]|nr:Calcineurin-like phosphoesterase [Aspergillus sp. HF37]